MRRALSICVVLLAGSVGNLFVHTVHVAAATPIPANTCQTDTSPNCRSYIVPTTWRDPSNQLVNIYLEVRHLTDSGGTIIPAPVILTYTPYAILGRNGDAAHWNSLGYTRAYADVVGTGNSGGCWDYGGPAEKQTAYDLIEAIAAQPWSNGKIGMLGGSYDGTTQYAAAVTHPPHLTTIVPEAAIDRWYDYAFAGGIRYFHTNEFLGYEGVGTAGDEGIDTPLGFDFGLAIPPPVDNTDPMWTQRFTSHFNVCQQVEHTMYGYSQTPDYNQFWLDRDYLKDLPTVTIPVLVATNFGDWNVKQVDGWQAYHALTNSVFARMYFGSRWHGHGVPPGSAYSATLDKWFAHWLQGANNGLEQTLAPVTSATTDSSGPSHDSYSSGPEPAPNNLPLYLSHAADGTWALSPQGGVAPAGSPPATFQWTGTNTETNDVLHPFANVPNGGGTYITFTSPVLTRDVRLFGEPVLHLWSTVQQQWVTYTPFLIDFDPSKYSGSGAATTSTMANAIPAMTRGWLDSRYRNGLSSQVLVTPGQPFSENIALWPQDYTLRAGHRLILVVSTETTEWDVPKPYGTPGLPTVQLNYEQGQSYVTLPIVGVSSADALFTSAPVQTPEASGAALLLLIPGAAGFGLLLKRRRAT